MVAKTVAVLPTCTERLVGRIEATSGLGPAGGVSASLAILPAVFSSTQILLSGPMTRMNGPEAAVGMMTSLVTVPATVIRPTLLLPFSENHSAPSGPAVIAKG